LSGALKSPFGDGDRVRPNSTDYQFGKFDPESDLDYVPFKSCNSTIEVAIPNFFGLVISNVTLVIQEVRSGSWLVGRV